MSTRHFKKKKLCITFIVQNEVAFGSVNGKFWKEHIDIIVKLEDVYCKFS